MFDAGFILPSNFNNSLRHIGWTRSSRTDKGVHSLATIISFKAELTRKQEDLMKQDVPGISLANVINRKLPENIRIFSVQKCLSSYSARTDTVARHYEYLIPFSLFNNDTNKAQKFNATLQNFLGTNSFHNFAEIAHEKEEAMEEEDLEEVEQEKTPSNDSSEQSDMMIFGKEYMKNIYKAQIDRVIKIGNEQYFIVGITGQSFARHQIRKMIGSALCVTFGILPDNFVKLCLDTNQKIPTPLAPGESLVLIQADARPRKDYHFVDFNQLPIHQSRDAFKKDFLYGHLRDLVTHSNGETIFDPFLEQSNEMYKKLDTNYFVEQQNAAVPFMQWRMDKRKQKTQKREEMMAKFCELPRYKISFHTLLPDGFITSTKCSNHRYIDPYNMTCLQIGLKSLFLSNSIPIEAFNTVESLSSWIKEFKGGYAAIEAIGKKNYNQQNVAV